MHACTAVSRGVSVQVPLESFDASRLKEDDVPLFTRGKRVNRRRDQVDYDDSESMGARENRRSADSGSAESPGSDVFDTVSSCLLYTSPSPRD